jgi:hypothetical protein
MAPHCGHAAALSLIEAPHSLQAINAIYITPCYLIRVQPTEVPCIIIDLNFFMLQLSYASLLLLIRQGYIEPQPTYIELVSLPA